LGDRHVSRSVDTTTNAADSFVRREATPRGGGASGGATCTALSSFSHNTTCLPHSLTHSRNPSLTCSLAYSFARARTRLLTHSINQSITSFALTHLPREAVFEVARLQFEPELWHQEGSRQKKHHHKHTQHRGSSTHRRNTRTRKKQKQSKSAQETYTSTKRADKYVHISKSSGANINRHRSTHRHARSNPKVHKQATHKSTTSTHKRTKCTCAQKVHTSTPSRTQWQTQQCQNDAATGQGGRR
jgi:hypothetical protein